MRTPSPGPDDSAGGATPAAGGGRRGGHRALTPLQLALLGLLLLQVLLIVATRGAFTRPRAATGPQALLPALESVAPAKVEIHGAEGKQVTLVREGSRWGIAEAGGYPADSAKLRTMLQSLEDIKVRRPVVSSGRYHRALKVSDAEHERRVRVWAEPKGKPVVGVYLGSSPNYRITHVRKEGEDRVYEASGVGVYDVPQEPGGWIDARLAEVEADGVTAFRLENSRGRFGGEKGVDGTWRLAGPGGAPGAPLDATKVGELIRRASSLYVSEPGGALDRGAQGFERPAASITLMTARAAPDAAADTVARSAAGRTEVTILVGGKVPGQDAKRYVTREGFGFAAVVYESAVEKLIGQRAGGLK